MEPTAKSLLVGLAWEDLHLLAHPPPPMHDLGVAFGGAEPTDTSPAGLSTSLSQSHSTCIPFAAHSSADTDTIQPNPMLCYRQRRAGHRSRRWGCRLALLGFRLAMEARSVGGLYVMGHHAPSFPNTTKVFLFLRILCPFPFHLKSRSDIVSSSSSVVLLHTEFRRRRKH